MQVITVLIAIIILAAAPARAASPQVEAAIKAVPKIETDPEKFRTYCRLSKEMAAVEEEDSAKTDELGKQLEELMKSIGPDVAAAWELLDELDPDTDDGKALIAAYEALEEKCSG
jgi:hypothetical protein